MGIGPGYGAPAAPMPSVNQLTNNTFAAFGDLDASPTKAWIATHPNQADGRFFNIAFGRRPEEELFDLRTDADQAKNVAKGDAYESVRKELSARLMKVLKETGDPRVTGDGTTFDKPPFSGEWRRPSRKPQTAIRKK